MPERPNGHDWKSCVRPLKVHRGFESPSLRQMSSQNMIAGPRATEDCEPRQVRKEAAVAITNVCYGNPGYHLFSNRGRNMIRGEQ